MSQKEKRERMKPKNTEEIMGKFFSNFMENINLQIHKAQCNPDKVNTEKDHQNTL